MIEMIQNFVRGTDAAVARAYLAMFRERNGVLAFLFHSLFRDESEMSRNAIDPLERTTVAKFAELISYYLEHGFHFIGPDELLSDLDPSRKYVAITFDDGYFNNSLALPILEKFGVPATFFIATDNVLQNKCYWWDVLYRERLAQGAHPRQIYLDAIAMKSMRTEQIESELKAKFGDQAFQPRGDIDRPFTPTELREFSSNKWVHLGNHTANHAILTNYTLDEVSRQVQGAQDSLQEMTGKTPIAIAYPNGANNPQIVQACREIGLKVGFTVRPAKNIIPLGEKSSDLMRLHRFCPTADGPIVSQCRTYRSDFLLYGMLRGGYLRMVRGLVWQ